MGRHPWGNLKLKNFNSNQNVSFFWKKSLPRRYRTSPKIDGFSWQHSGTQGGLRPHFWIGSLDASGKRYTRQVLPVSAWTSSWQALKTHLKTLKKHLKNTFCQKKPKKKKKKKKKS